ncbi:MAG: TonB-dependent hemin receptor HmbR [Idiomarinaceae bacterium HL-53]|nr:MAG: TonB-dependent hemin receptor HmbR [Idiomarinaceae bacterium HL-53]CUS48010.1 hemoglobin/transferrin/lactoferrin receptor protein [Idiomarinaceae bacterium HL-53]
MKRHQSSRHRIVVAAIGTFLVATSTHVYAESSESEDNTVEEVIVVTGSRTEQNFRDVAGDISVVSDIELERQVTTNLADAFRYDPAINSTGAAGSSETLTVRGIGGNRLIFIKDGRRLNDAYAGGGGFLVGRGYLDLTQIKTIEVAKSAASSLYGSDGLGGIVVITTPDPDDLLRSEPHFLEVSSSYRSVNDEHALTTSGAADFGHWQGMLNIGYRQGHETQNFTETLPGYDFDAQSLLAKATFKLDPQKEVKLTLDHFEQENEQIIAAQSNETQEDDAQTAFSVDIQNTRPSDWADNTSAQIYYSHYLQESDQVRDGNGRSGAYIDYNDYRFEQNIIGIRWQANKSIENQEWVYGIDADHYDTERPRYKTRVLANGTLEQDNEPQLTFPGADTLLLGVFAQNTFSFENDWRLTAGVRADYYHMEPKNDPMYDLSLMDEIKETSLSPKLSIVVPLSASTNVYGQYTRGFRIPPHDQAYQNHGVEPFYAIIPNADLEPEKSDAFEMGIKHFGEQFNFTFALFYSDFKDFIESQLVGNEPTFIPGVNKSIFQYQNIESAEIYGAEAAMKYWLSDHLSLSASALWMSGENKESGEYLSSISPLSGSAQLEYELNGWYATLALRAEAGMNKTPAPELIETPGWGTVDLMFGKEFAHWQLNLALLNLADKRVVPYNRVAGQATDIDTEQYSQPGRSAAIRVSYTF